MLQYCSMVSGMFLHLSGFYYHGIVTFGEVTLRIVTY